MPGSVSVSITTNSPTDRPGLLTRVALLDPLTASAARLVDQPHVNQSIPIVMRLALVPTGILSLVCDGPWPRRTMPLVISSGAVILKSPAESRTTCPTGHE